MPSPSNCQNCNAVLSGNFCSTCGQEKGGIDRFFLRLVHESLEDIFHWESRAWKTLSALLFKPGLLSNEYFGGRRVSYVQPIRLYLITSVLFFVSLTVLNFFAGQERPETNDGDTSSAITRSIEPSASKDKSEPDTQSAALDPELTAEQKTEIEEARKGLSELELDLPFVSEQTEKALKDGLQPRMERAIKLATEDNRFVASALLELAPPVIFCLLPLFAALLKLAYVGSRFYYAEHLVYAVHNHAFIFLSLTVYALVDVVLRDFPTIGDWVGVIMISWIPIYLWRSMRAVYQQGRFFTTLKFIALSAAYIAMLVTGIVFAILVGLMTL